ncbi:MAG TPA: condensation domain-containing protein, partial [Myxococcus sp.]|nr:condensation domain-containing protein [Myxococcus sp.]
LTPSGKLARKLLPAPDASSLRGDAPFTAPRTPVEEKLAQTFRDVLRLESVSVTDSFFALGGHSLLATQVISRVRSTFGVEVPVRALFEAPSVEGLAQRIEHTQAQSHRGPQRPPLVPVPRTGALPLSFAQQRLWFIDQLEPGNATYNLPVVVRLKGPLDVATLQRSLTEVVRRHEALRTTFVAREGEPLQLIAPPAPVALQQVDLSSLEAEAAHAEALRLMGEELHRPFALESGPLLRAQVLKLAPAEHMLVLNTHHIVSDGWSQGVLVREVTALYEAFLEGRPSPLPELPVQYADFAMWQRSWLRGAVLDEQLRWWKQQLSGAPHALELPTDFHRPAVQSFRGASFLHRFPASLDQVLGALCEKEGATPFMALLAATQTLLARYSGQDDVVIGSPIAGRHFAELEGLIGLFINTLALRSRLDDNPSFRTLLGRVKESTLGAYAHQDVPFEKLVEELQPARDLSRSPLFQAMLILQNTEAAEAGALSGAARSGTSLTLHPVEASSGHSRFDLTLSFSRGSEGLLCAVEYCTDLFREDTVRRLMGHLQVLLEAVTAHPEQRMLDVPLLPPSERHTLLVESSDPRTSLRRTLVHQLVSEQAVRTPEATALVAGTGRLTYRQLDERSNRLAWYLRELGLGPEVRAAVCMERTADLVVALLAILKAGGTYVPLDPNYPRQRLDFTLSDSGARLLLSQRPVLESLQLDARGVDTVCLDSLPEAFSRLPSSTPPCEAVPDNLSHVIYTSGSTGRPKGVALEHRSAVSFLRWALSAFSSQQM